MKLFLHRIILFFIPILLFVSLPWWVLHQGRENGDIDQIFSSSQAGWLIGYAYRQNVYKYFKTEALRRRPKYDIVAMGSSRTLQFRDCMFSGQFFCAGTATEKLPEFVTFYSLIPPEKRPSVIIMGLDQWLLNENDTNLKDYDSSEVYLRNPTRVSYSRFHNVWMDLFAGKIDLKKLFFRPELPLRIGLQAVLKENGYRYDGSYRSDGERDLSLSVKERMVATHRLIDRHQSRFQRGEHVSSDALQVLSDFLRSCRADGIYVIGFLPPFADEIWERMVTSGDYEYLHDVFPQAQAVFSEFGFPLFDFSSMSRCGASDSEVFDGFHAGEKTYWRIIERMARGDEVLAPYVDVSRVRNFLEQSENPFYIYSD